MFRLNKKIKLVFAILFGAALMWMATLPTSAAPVFDEKCDDGTAIPSVISANDGQKDFCGSKGFAGSSTGGGPSATTCGGQNQPICLGSQTKANDVCGGRDSDPNKFNDSKEDSPNAVEISFNIGCNQSFENPLLDGAFAIFRALSVAAGVIVVASIVVAGIQYTTSMGQPDKTLAAIKRIRSALIALLLYLFMFALIQWLVPGGLF